MKFFTDIEGDIDRLEAFARLMAQKAAPERLADAIRNTSGPDTHTRMTQQYLKGLLTLQDAASMNTLYKPLMEEKLEGTIAPAPGIGRQLFRDGADGIRNNARDHIETMRGTRIFSDENMVQTTTEALNVLANGLQMSILLQMKSCRKSAEECMQHNPTAHALMGSHRVMEKANQTIARYAEPDHFKDRARDFRRTRNPRAWTLPSELLIVRKTAFANLTALNTRSFIRAITSTSDEDPVAEFDGEAHVFAGQTIAAFQNVMNREPAMHEMHAALLPWTQLPLEHRAITRLLRDDDVWQAETYR